MHSFYLNTTGDTGIGVLFFLSLPPDRRCFVGNEFELPAEVGAFAITNLLSDFNKSKGFVLQ